MNIEKILNEMQEICDVWVKVDGTIKEYNQDEIHCIYAYIQRLQNELKDIFDDNNKKQNQLEAYENMRKEVKSFIERHKNKGYNFGNLLESNEINGLLNILNKVGEDN